MKEISDEFRWSVDQWVTGKKDELVGFLKILIQVPSENRPPTGNELPVQHLLEKKVRELRFETELYSLSNVHGLMDHEAYYPGRDYTNRPNLFARIRGTGGGRSLLFSVHSDVVPGIDGEFEAFCPVERNGRLYGRGSNDMKGGIAAILTAFSFFSEKEIPLKGDILFESVVDEEMGGANGTLAGRIRDHHADAVIIPEPTNMKVCPSHLGGVTWRITLKGKGGMGFGGESLSNPIYGISRIVCEIERFHDECKNKVAFRTKSGEVLTPNVVLSYIKGGDFEPGMADGIPQTCSIEVWVECLPGETLQDVERDFKNRLQALCNDPSMQAYEVFWEQITRFLPGSFAKTELTPILCSLVSQECGVPEEEHMAPFACDAFMFNLYSPSPAIILGPIGENAHAADEFVDVDSLMRLTKVYILAIAKWCNMSPLGIINGEEDRYETMG
ncbi:acetylornithine deacetylase [Paenibacillus tianmuensis]|uniref:Acetylornithine deacetylase n=1 Tax=Paenibacillus tianmuensis TaxID=624147 RepID=A0A1G4PQ34_9BACL|nr:M20/M25/M40 family metallo-hydrolase [Paenibacillus tianmuensis]SCW34382.1 acetylornithine deacetylase [Paenibacillus tianmuensis]